MIYSCFLLLSAKKRSQWWLLLVIFLNVLGFLVIIQLQDHSEPHQVSSTSENITTEGSAIRTNDSDGN